MIKKKATIVKYIIRVILGIIIAFVGASFVRVHGAYNGVYVEVMRQHQVVADLDKNARSEESQRIGVSHSQKLTEDFERSIYDDLFRIDPYGGSSLAASGFVYNIGARSSFVASLYCWLKSRGTDINKEVSLKCLRCLYFMEATGNEKYSLRHFFTNVFLESLLNKEYETKRLKDLKEATRSMMEEEGGGQKERC